MKRYYTLFSILLSIVSAQAQDSLVRYSEIHFTSDFERKAFHKFFKKGDQSGVVELLLSPSPVGPAQILITNARLDETVKKLEAQGLDGKKPEKRLKTITDQVKSSFLTYYNPIIGFSEIFSSGAYNSISATALYALIFDRLKIPYAIQEKPTHVFPVIYPDQQKIVGETTPLDFSYRMFDAKYQESFVGGLKNSHRIGDAEVQAFTTEGLFIRHFYANRNISLPELIGLHYLNDSYQKSDKNDYAAAFRQCEKSYLFFPSTRCTFTLMNLGALVLQHTKLSPKERALFIAKVSRYNDWGITAEMIQGEFSKLNDEVLVRNNDRQLYRECADIVVNQGLQEDEIRNGVRYFQYYELGRADYNQGRYGMAKYNFAKALDIQPKNAELSATFLGTLAFSLRNTNDPSVLDTVLVYKKRFPLLDENNNFKSLLANAYLVASADGMNANNLKLAEQYMSDFEKIYEEGNADKSLIVNPNLVGEAYSKLCTYYFKKNQKEKARALVKKGLEIAPDSYELRIRQQMLN
jgi:tetratricopeptide (TPR) repeat protein